MCLNYFFLIGRVITTAPQAYGERPKGYVHDSIDNFMSFGQHPLVLFGQVRILSKVRPSSPYLLAYGPGSGVTFLTLAI